MDVTIHFAVEYGYFPFGRGGFCGWAVVLDPGCAIWICRFGDVSVEVVSRDERMTR